MSILRFAARIFCLTGPVLGSLAADGFYRLENQDDQWFVRDPSGRPTRLVGVDQVRWDGMPCERMNWRRPYEEHNRATYCNRRAWEDETLARLKSWGFNMLGACSDDSLRHRGLLHAIFLNLSEDFCTGERNRWCAEYKGVPNTAMPNVFHPDFPDYCDRVARKLCAPNRDDKDLLGYFIDNELVWQSADDPALAAERYFKLTTEAIRKYDPNHLVLGCRFAGLDGAPESVWAAAGRYCDVVTFNCYPWADLDRNVVLDAKGGRPIVERFEAVYRLTHRPLLITEWSFPALDTGRPCLNGAGQRFKTQAERVEASGLFVRTMLAQPYVLGHSYFMWLDQPVLGTNGEHPEDCNYGLVSETGVPYDPLVRMFAALDRDVNILRKNIAMPKERHLPVRRKEPSAAELFKSSVTDECGRVAFERKGRRWRMANAEGLLLAGWEDGTNMIEEVRLGGICFGRYNGMVQVVSEGGAVHWIAADSVRAVSYESEGCNGMLLVTAVGKADRLTVEMTHRVTMASCRKDFLCEIVRIRNVGQEGFTIRRVYLCPFAEERDPAVRRGVPNLWNGPRECHWVMSDKKSYGMISPDLSAEWFNLWIDPDGRQHPDINFLPEETVRLLPGKAYEPSVPMGAISVVANPQ